MTDRVSRRIYLSTFLLAFSTLFFEIALTRVFSVLSWHHFTQMIIGIALLGFGIAGSSMTLRQRRDPHFLSPAFIARNAYAYGFATIVSLLLITRIDFEPLNVAQDWSQLISLFAFYVLLTVPFYFAGMCLGGIITIYRQDINRVYFSDLFGAAIGALVSLPAIHAFGVTNMIFFVALLAGVTGLVMDSFGKGFSNVPNWLKVGFFAAIFLAGMKFDPYLVHVPSSKPLFTFANRAKGADQVEYSKWDVVARVDIIKPFDRVLSTFSGDVSSVVNRTRWTHLFICQDGQACTGTLKSDGDIKKMSFLNGYLQAAPYIVKKKPVVLVIGLGGGIDGLIALYNDAIHLTGVDVNPLMVDAITRRYAAYAGRLFNQPHVKVVTAEGRHFLSTTQDCYDVIQLSGVDTFTALASGAYALTENYLYTTEAMGDFWNHLTAEGILSFSRWWFKPPRETLRLITMEVEAIEKAGIQEPWRHFAVVKGQKWAETLLKKTPFTKEEVAGLDAWANVNDFEIAYDPFTDRKTEYDTVLRSGPAVRAQFYETYLYNVKPSTDNKPFFFDYYKWKHLFRKEGGARGYITTNLPLSLITLIISLAQILILALVGILYPWLKAESGDRARAGRGAVALYFGSLGLAFIFVEIALIQKLMVFVGGPAYSFSISLFSILLFSGLGSWYAKRITMVPAKLFVALPIALLVLAVGVSRLLSFAIPHLLDFGLGARGFFAVAMFAPLAFLMGMPFPLGITALGRYEPKLVPWAWALNSFMTVFGSLFCIFVSMFLGFHAAFIIAGFVYLAGFFAFRQVVRAGEKPSI